MTWPFSSTIKVDCPDGPRFILKHPEKAFAITFPDWDVRVNALVKFFTGSQAKVDPKILKKTKSIVKNLTENYAALQAHYQAAYLAWCGNPCSKEAEKARDDANKMIREKEFALKEVESKALKIADQIRTRQRKKPLPGKGIGGGRGEWEKEIPRIPSRERRIPVPETEFENIQELVAKLKI